MEYYSLNRFLRDKFGQKVIKLSLDGGFTCPNRDGSISLGGCIFCSAHGSGDFSGTGGYPIDSKGDIDPITNQQAETDICVNQDKKDMDATVHQALRGTPSIAAQIAVQKDRLNRKWKNSKYIAYFQAYTNTYASIPVLRRKYSEALAQKDVVGLAIATRPDCIDDDVLSLLGEISQKTYLWVELGLQTSKEESVRFINRGYDNKVYTETVNRLRAYGIDVVTHVILGLPGETREDMLNTVRFALAPGIQGIKLQLLHVLQNTALGELYVKQPFPVLCLEDYGNIICDCLDIIPQDVVIHRLTGDGAKKDLIAPLWSGDKKMVLNYINRKIKEKKFAKL